VTRYNLAMSDEPIILGPGALYSRRLGMVEPVFGQIKANRRIGRFKRRGRAAASSEWRLIAATHNLLKLHRHTLAAATG
jgi:Transposase DDE domain